MASLAEIDRAIANANRAGDARAVQELTNWRNEMVPPVTGADTVRGMLSGATLGFGDELRGLAGVPFGLDYERVRDFERQKLGEFRQNHPGTATLTEFTGGVGTGLAGGAKVAASKAGQAMQRLPFMQRAGVASAAGGATGATVGLGEAESMQDAPGKMAAGGITGALLGPVAEAGGTAAQGVGRAVSRAVDTPAGVRRRLSRALKEDKLTPEQVAAKMRNRGPDAVPADVSEGLRGELDLAVNMPGKTKGQAEKVFRKRQREAFDELMEPFGPGRKIETLDELKTIRREGAGPLYAKAYERETPFNDEIREVFEKETIQKFWKSPRMKRYAQEAADADGIPYDPSMFDAAEPSTMGLDHLIRGLDREIGRRLRGVGKADAVPLLKLRDQLRDAVTKANPTLHEARSMWSGTMRFEEAMEEGKKFLTESSAVTVDRLKKLGASEKEAYKIGVVQAIEDRLERAAPSHNLTKFLMPVNVQRKMRALFDTNKEFRQFMNRVTRVAEKHKTSGVLHNSKTASRLARQDDQLSQEAMSVASDVLLTGAPIQSSVGRGLGGILKRSVGPREAVRNEVGSILLNPDPQALARGLLSPPSQPLTGPGLLAPIALGAGGGLLTTR